MIAVGNLGAGVVAARLLSLEERGVAAGLLSTVTLAVYLLDLGISPALQFFVAKGRIESLAWRREPLLQGLVAVSVLTALIVIVRMHAFTAGIIIATVLFATTNCVVRWCNALVLGAGNFNSVNRNRLIQTSSWLSTLPLALFIWPDSNTYLLVFAGSWAVAAAAAVRTSHALGLMTSQAPKLIMDRVFWRYALPTHLAGQNAIDAFRLDLVLAAVLMPGSSVALLAIASSYAAQVRIVAVAVAPIVNVRAAQQPMGITRHVVRSLATYMTLTLLAAMALAILSPFLIPLVFGEAYRGAVLPAIVYSAAGVASAFRALGGERLRGHGMPGVTVGIEVLLAIVLVTSITVRDQTTPLDVAICVLLAQITGAAGTAVALRRANHV